MAKDAREILGLVCTVCHEVNYKTSRNTKLTKEKLNLKKYCSRCKKRQDHKETKNGVRSKK